MKVQIIKQFMEERQRIYRKKRAGNPWPWTKDPILQKYKFCCVYREDDAVTVWIRKNWRKPYAEHANLWFAMCVARQINWPETLAAIGFPVTWDPAFVTRQMRQRQENGQKLFSGAYMITADHSGIDQVTHTVRDKLDPIYHHVQAYGAPWQNRSRATLQEVWDWFQEYKFHCFGPFISYEVVTDLRHTRYLCDAPDINTWANAGPGALRGLNRLNDRPLAFRLKPEQALKEMRELYRKLSQILDRSLLPTLEMRDIEHSLCEVDKYLRASERLEAGETIGLERYQPAKRGLF